ncbi:hypothetical protein THAOC_30563, partial [Thalassiosira oceanica]
MNNSFLDNAENYGTTSMDKCGWTACNVPVGEKVCPSFLPTKACNRTVALSRTNLVDRTLARQMEGYNRRKASFPRTGAGQHSSPLCWPGRVSIVAMCAPEGVPSGHEEGEARQLKTNPFPTQSYPTKRPVQLISSNKPRDGRVGEKFVTSDAAEDSAGPRIHYLDAPQTQPSSARLQRQQAGRGRLKPGVRQNRVTTALGARRFLGLPLRNATCLLASTPCPSAFNQLWRWGPGREEGWTNMRERVYRPGRGPRQHNGVGFGVSQATRTAKSQ